ncbi:MAG TPA: ABC transporter substrate-binding protein [Mycobacterium sp.]|uniref:ABC transporter substrate-binding protein n=1 Tax=Mycolicibacterium sp. TaxID=2320850 RepID=UPI0025EDBFE9|nr:ABC transporter substrate-binding protein [Mycolicibacterium sp.]HQC77959.1 ABC transporter substrate-binding protein [Mycobacterium sp.]
MVTARENGVRWWQAAVVVAAVGAVTLSGCSKSGESGSGSTAGGASVSAKKVDEIAASVPDDIKSTGKLVVGVNIPYAPNEFKDASGKIVGFDVDLMNAVASTMGLTADFREADFAKIIPSIQQGTFNVGMSSFTDTKERQASVDFVDYFTAGIQWAKRPGTEIDPNDACGKKVAVQATTVEETDELPGKSKKCVDAGKPEIQILKFDSQDAATNAVILGQADAMSADSPVTAYAIKQSNGKLEPAGDLFEAAPYGWPVKKGSPLAQSMLKALEHLIASGDYKSIATNWGLEKGMLEKPVINGATS